MNGYVITLALAGLCTAMSVHAAAAQGPAQDGVPTFSKDVAPILFNSCVQCHRPGETAPMSLLSFKDARPWARAIKRAVQSRVMPPWPADRAHGAFKNDPSLSDAEIDTIARWVDGGSPEGNAADLPAAPTFAEGWHGGTPDYVFEMPIDYTVPADGQIDIMYFWVKVPFAEDRFLQALELRPGNPAVVHHARVDVVKLPEGLKVVDGKPVRLDGSPDDGLDANGQPRNILESQDTNYHLISFVPGRGYEAHPEGSAKRLEGGQWVRFELHYNPTGRVTTDRTKLGLWFAKQPVTHQVYTRSVGQALSRATPGGSMIYVEGKALPDEIAADGTRRRGKLPNIPPRADNWEIVGVTSITEPIRLIALSPHMHLRGKDLKWIVTWPDGREETILSVPNYDYNWQLNFELEQPLDLPVGSKLTAIGHYDNSAKNRYNPAPDKEVFWSDQSWDEMFIPYIEFTKDESKPRPATRDQN